MHVWLATLPPTHELQSAKVSQMGSDLSNLNGDIQKSALRVIMSLHTANDNDSYFKAVPNDTTVLYTLHTLEN